MICSACKLDLPTFKFRRRTDRPRGFSYSCVSCERKYNRDRWSAKIGCYPDKRPRHLSSGEYSAAWSSRRKKKVISHYSGGTCSCARCGFSDMRALSIDHINGDGHVDRKTFRSSSSFYSHILKEKPPGLQVLCMNCQFIKKHENGEWAGGRPLKQD